MIQISTHDDVIRYVYEETNHYENEQIEDALADDQELLTFYLDTLETKQLMNKIVRTPSDRCVQNILDFSRNYSAM
jgi:peptidyl-tRNA hydrolase